MFTEAFGGAEAQASIAAKTATDSQCGNKYHKMIENSPHLWYTILVRKYITNVGAVSGRRKFYYETVHI